MSEETELIETKEVPLDQATQPEYKKARADGKETATRETVVETEKGASEKEDKPKIKGGFQARIDRLIKQQATLEEQKTAAEKRALDAEAKLNGTDKLKETDEPQREKFESESDYIRALTRWEVKQEMKAAAENEQKRAYENKVKEARSRYNVRMIALQEANPEIKEIMNQAISVPTVIEGPITEEMDNGEEVAVFLAQNPEICKELLEMSASRAIAAVWRISEKLEAGGKDEDSEEQEEKEEVKAKEVEEKPKLRPLRTVTGGGTSRSTIPLDKADFASFKKLRSQGRVQ